MISFDDILLTQDAFQIDYDTLENISNKAKTVEIEFYYRELKIIEEEYNNLPNF